MAQWVCYKPISIKSRDTSEFNSTGQPKLVTLVDKGGASEAPPPDYLRNG